MVVLVVVVMMMMMVVVVAYSDYCHNLHISVVNLYGLPKKTNPPKTVCIILFAWSEGIKTNSDYCESNQKPLGSVDTHDTMLCQ